MKRLISLVLIFSALGGCTKYLDAKPDQSLTEPSSLKDLSLMLDAYDYLNIGYPSLNELSSDNFYLTDASWNSCNAAEQPFYIWQPYDQNTADYANPNKVITTVNLILSSLDKISAESNGTTANRIKGSALFFRAFSYWVLAQGYCLPYDKQTAKTDLGLPIRLTPEVLGIFSRSTVEQTYQRMITDLSTAVPLLPDTADVKYHVGKNAAYAMLSRVYLSMQEYASAGLYADSCLKLSDALMDYNGDGAINQTSTTIPFVKWNREVIFDAQSRSTSMLVRTRAIVDTLLYRSYNNNDLRKTLFFQANSAKTGYYFKGNYTGLSSAAMFYGIGKDEMLLTRAECEARNGNTNGALNDLNKLLLYRYKRGTFIPYTITNNMILLDTILNERRKELLYRGLRWVDLKRLNKEPKYKVTLTRKINGVTYTLSPGGNRYVFLFPAQSINISGNPQNP